MNHFRFATSFRDVGMNTIQIPSGKKLKSLHDEILFVIYLIPGYSPAVIVIKLFQ